MVVSTWLALGWWFGEPLLAGDGPRLFAPYVQSALEAGPDWTDHLYRFGVVGGSAMHPVAGTSPIVQVGSVLGLSPTTIANAGAITVQVLLAYFGMVLIESLVRCWSDAPSRLSPWERVVATWCCAFVPVIGWRFGAGHENLLQGLLPWVAVISLWWGARARAISPVSLLLGWFAVFYALSSAGQQTLVYSVVFGAPILLATVLGGPRGSRGAHRMHLAVGLALAAGVLCAAPRLAEMLHYHLGDDASRGVARSMFHAYGRPHVHDWLTSVPWTASAAHAWPGVLPAHETNYPFGPLVVLAIARWPRARAGELGLAVVLSALLAIVFSLDLEPVSLLLRQLPMIDAFRVPARAILPVLVVVPAVALAALWARGSEPLSRRHTWLVIGGGFAILVVARVVPSVARELLAWPACGLLVWWSRGRAERPRGPRAAGALALVAALGVMAFHERARGAHPPERIEDGPRALRAQILARSPALAMPLARVLVPARPPPFEKSTAFAAGLSSLDGVWFPPRRFLLLLGALWGQALSAAEADFDVTSHDRFDLLAQLYNVHFLFAPDGRVIPFPRTNGPAWFVHEAVLTDDRKEMARALLAPGVDPRAVLARTAWVLRAEAPGALPSDAACARARVLRVATDELGQTARLEVAAEATCILVVATNYAGMLRARVGAVALPVFPVDVALTGILVPPGTHDVVLGPVPHAPWWTWASVLVAWAMLASAIASLGGRRE